MRIQNVHATILPPGGVEPEEDDSAKNAEAFAELIQCLDDQSLSLVLNEAPDNGRKALQILRGHYLGTGKPRILALYTELTSLKMSPSETVTDYVLRAETAAQSLKHAQETVSDSLLIAMVLKGLPPEYKTFSTIIVQRESAMIFSDFKKALRSHEETEKASKSSLTHHSEDSVMHMANKGSSIVCYACCKPDHKSPECKSSKSQKPKGQGRSRWCENCKKKSHNTSECRSKKIRQDSAKTAATSSGENEQKHSFVFKVGVDLDSANSVQISENALLVDTGATSHIFKDKSKFIDLDESVKPENHLIELADGSRTSGIVRGKGVASTTIHDSDGKSHDIILENVLYIPSYNRTYFSRVSQQERCFCKFWAGLIRDACTRWDQISYL
ncbi:uncharacterized protein LOC117121761 [Anneissia japonica]|uniref:uncharacterized protein LOC117121761 n=1 Tax=Anneissia japonica TaxID=1529436 RepID=UPI001425710D|nr:uncharacterized protein LOC117121761 [Anneissia japonica]